MAGNYNYTNKIIDREMLNTTIPTSITAGGSLNNSENLLTVTATRGYIKSRFSDSIPIEIFPQTIEGIVSVIRTGGLIDFKYDGNIAVCINVDSKIVFVEIENLDLDDADNSKYIQLGQGIFSFENGLFQVTFRKNCVLGLETAEAFKYLSNAIGRISNLKIRPSATHPMRIETYLKVGERASRFLYGGNANESLKEDLELRFSTSKKSMSMHRPSVEVGEINNLQQRKKGERLSGNNFAKPLMADVSSFSPNLYSSEIVRDAPVPDGKWVVCSVDMKEDAGDIITSGELRDDSFILYHDPVAYNSKHEAKEACGFIDTETQHTRLGWVLMRSGCTDLSDTNFAEVISTDRFGTQMINPPRISDEERARDIKQFIDSNSGELLFTQDGRSIMDIKGCSLKKI